MPSREALGAQLRCGQADKNGGIQADAFCISLLHIPSTRNVNGNNWFLRLVEELQGTIEGGSDGGLEGEAKDRVKNDV